MNKRIAKAKTTKKVEPKSATANTDASACLLYTSDAADEL